MKKSFLVTGAAGFIGAALVKRLIANGERVIGIDSLNDYYDKRLKETRLSQINSCSPENSWSFYKFKIEDLEKLRAILRQEIISASGWWLPAKP